MPIEWNATAYRTDTLWQQLHLFPGLYRSTQPKTSQCASQCSTGWEAAARTKPGTNNNNIDNTAMVNAVEPSQSKKRVLLMITLLALTSLCP